MRIFITGGTGFIGPYVVNRLLRDNHELLLLKNTDKVLNAIFLEKYKNLNIVSGNLSNLANWKDPLVSFSPDLAIHMAWEGIPDYKAKMSTKNLQNSLNLFLNLADIGCNGIITAGSCWEYGITRGKVSEDMNPIPTNSFTAAKNSLRIMGEEIAKEYEMQFIWTRFFYVYGPRQKSSSLLPYIISSALKKAIPKIETPHSRNDFIYVEDIAEAIASIVKKCKKSQTIYNIGSGYSTSVKTLVEIAYEKTNTPLPRNIFAESHQRNKDVDFWADISRIKADTGWEPRVSIAEGIEEMLNHYLSQ